MITEPTAAERIRHRLAEATEEFAASQARLRELDVEATYLRERLLMLRGAITVLEELSAADPDRPD